MTELVSLPPLDPALPLPRLDVAESIDPIVIGVGIALVVFYRWVEQATRDADEKHLRAERLAAYKVRQKWKASDIRPLLTIGVSQSAQRRLAVLKGKGRPVVKPHRPLEDVLREKLTNWSSLLCEDAKPSERRRSFRAWPWWKHHVEALYRGELNAARVSGVRGPSDHSERTVARALRLSQGAVRMICGEIRAQRREDPDSASFPPMVLAEYEGWMECGVFPLSLRD